MSFKCNYKVMEKTLKISVPKDRTQLPGRLLRSMFANIETRYQIFEFFEVEDVRQADDLEDVLEVLPYHVPRWNRLFGKSSAVVFLPLHRCFRDPKLIRVSREEMYRFKKEMYPGEELVEEDFTYEMSDDCYLLVTDNLKKFVTVVQHLQLRSFDEMREAAARLGDASVTVFDRADIYIEYDHESFPSLLTYGLEDWLLNPIVVDTLDD